jgi:copper resistance protein B
LIRREFAPYVGVEWGRKYGATADFARDADEDVEDTRLVAGLRVWFWDQFTSNLSRKVR